MNRLVMVLFAVLWHWGCGFIPAEVEVDMDHPLFVAGGLSAVQPSVLPGVGSEVRQTLSNEGVSTDRVNNVVLTKLDLVHLSPLDCVLSGCDLSFIESLEVFVESEGLDSRRVGYTDSIGKERLISMQLEDLDLAPYIKADSMTFVARISLQTPPIQDVSMEVRTTLLVGIDI